LKLVSTILVLNKNKKTKVEFKVEPLQEIKYIAHTWKIVQTLVIYSSTFSRTGEKSIKRASTFFRPFMKRNKCVVMNNSKNCPPQMQ
jgi:hypothetical protein